MLDVSEMVGKCIPIWKGGKLREHFKGNLAESIKD